MARKILNIGVIANDGKGDRLRDAFSATQDNTAELYNFLGGDELTSLKARQKLNVPSVEDVALSLTPKADLTYVNTAIGAISTDAGKQYATLALANADIANIPLNKNIFVSEAANGGYWYKELANSTTLKKSPFDPFEQAKKDAKEKYMQKEQNNIQDYSLVIVDGLGRETWLKADATGNIPISVLTEIFGKDDRDLIVYERKKNKDNLLIIDQLGRIAFGVDEKGEFQANISQLIKDQDDRLLLRYENSNSAELIAYVDKLGRIAFSIDEFGAQSTTQKEVNINTDLTSWAFYGSSTVGYFQNPFFARLQQEFPNVQNQISYGMGGATASQHVIALGLFEPEITFTNNQITFGTNAVTHTLSEHGALVREVRVVLMNGIVGRLTVDSTFIVEIVPGSITLPLSLPNNFAIKATSLGVRKYQKACAVLNICKNDVTTAAGEAGKNLCLKLSIEAMNFLDKRNVYHTIMFGHFVNRGSTGTVAYINEINAKLKVLYADRFIDIQAYLMSDQVWRDVGITKTEADIAAISQQTLPPSLCLSDGIHLTDAVNLQFQKQFISLINILGWYK